MDWSELLNWDEYTKLLIGLLALTDPLGVLPVFMGLTENFSMPEKKKVLQMSLLTYSITLLTFTYLGTHILDLFGITISAFTVAGGVLFLFYALEMMGLIQFPTIEGSSQPSRLNTLGIVPLGIPLLAGPGTISKIVIATSVHDSIEHKLLVNLVILSTALIVFILWRTSLLVGRMLGKTTVVILNRVMGLILAAISIELILDGIAAHFPQIIISH